MVAVWQLDEWWWGKRRDPLEFGDISSVHSHGSSCPREARVMVVDTGLSRWIGRCAVLQVATLSLN